jgi:hypothetical protein
MGAAQPTGHGHGFATPEQAAAFYDNRKPGSNFERASVQRMAREYAQDHPDLTPRQREEGIDTDCFWPMARCLQFCQTDAVVTADGERRFQDGDARGPEQRFLKCLEQACGPVVARMNASLEKQYGRKFNAQKEL